MVIASVVIVALWSTRVSVGFAHKFESLKAMWLNESQHDTIRLQALDQFAWEGFLFKDPDSAFYFPQQEYDYAEKFRNMKYEWAGFTESDLQRL